MPFGFQITRYPGCNGVVAASCSCPRIDVRIVAFNTGILKISQNGARGASACRARVEISGSGTKRRALRRGSLETRQTRTSIAKHPRAAAGVEDCLNGEQRCAQPTAQPDCTEPTARPRNCGRMVSPMRTAPAVHSRAKPMPSSARKTISCVKFCTNAREQAKDRKPQDSDLQSTDPSNAIR